MALEVKENTIRDVPLTYGDVKEVYEEKWAKGYPYEVYKCVRIAMTNLKKHIPSQLTIAGARALISYESQPSTCYGCNEKGHISHDYRRRRQTESQKTTQTNQHGPILLHSFRCGNTWK